MHQLGADVRSVQGTLSRCWARLSWRLSATDVAHSRTVTSLLFCFPLTTSARQRGEGQPTRKADNTDKCIIINHCKSRGTKS